MMPFTKQHSAYAWVVTCILFLINLTFHNLPLHSSYKIHQPITDYFLRLPYSELLEKRLFRSRANRRLVFSPGAQRLGPSLFPGTAPDTRRQDFLACKPCRSYGLGQRLGRNRQGAIPDRMGTKTKISCLHRLRRPKGWAGG